MAKNDIRDTCDAYHLSAAEVVYCYALAAGAPPTAAYRAIFHPHTTISEEQLEQRARTMAASTPAVRLLTNRIKNGRTKGGHVAQVSNTGETGDEEEQLRTRSGIVSKIITHISGVTGKDAISGLQTLAKLQGFDKPDERPEEERRTYFLPFVSRCRSCQLWRIFDDVRKNGGGG